MTLEPGDTVVIRTLDGYLFKVGYASPVSTEFVTFSHEWLDPTPGTADPRGAA